MRCGAGAGGSAGARGCAFAGGSTSAGRWGFAATLALNGSRTA